MTNFKILKRCYRVNNYSDFLKKSWRFVYFGQQNLLCQKIDMERYTLQRY